MGIGLGLGSGLGLGCWVRDRVGRDQQSVAVAGEQGGERAAHLVRVKVRVRARVRVRVRVRVRANRRVGGEGA